MGLHGDDITFSITDRGGVDDRHLELESGEPMRRIYYRTLSPGGNAAQASHATDPQATQDTQHPPATIITEESTQYTSTGILPQFVQTNNNGGPGWSYDWIYTSFVQAISSLKAAIFPTGSLPAAA